MTPVRSLVDHTTDLVRVVAREDPVHDHLSDADLAAHTLAARFEKDRAGEALPRLRTRPDVKTEPLGRRADRRQRARHRPRQGDRDSRQGTARVRCGRIGASGDCESLHPTRPGCDSRLGRNAQRRLRRHVCDRIDIHDRCRRSLQRHFHGGRDHTDFEREIHGGPTLDRRRGYIRARADDRQCRECLRHDLGAPQRARPFFPIPLTAERVRTNTIRLHPLPPAFRYCCFPTFLVRRSLLPRLSLWSRMVSRCS